MTNNDFQLEELENAAVNKSNTAKRVGVAAGLMAATAGTAYAATTLAGGSTEPEPEVRIDESEIDNVAQTGANEVEDNAEEAQEQPQVVNNYYTVNVEEPQSQEPETSVHYDKTTHYYDEDGNIIGTSEEGTVNGHHFTIIDSDGDGGGDTVAIDANNNGHYEEDEIHHLEGNDQLAMGHATAQHEDVVLHDIDPVEPDPVDPWVEPDVIDDREEVAQNEDEEDGIHNDFEDDRAGEEYSNDYAENNENYNNNGDVDHAYAEYHHDGVAQEEPVEELTFEDYGTNDGYAEVSDDYTTEDYTADDYTEDVAMTEPVDDSYESYEESYDDSYAMDDSVADDSFDVTPDDNYDVI